MPEGRGSKKNPKTKADPNGPAFFISVEPVPVELEDLRVLEGLPVNHHPDEGDLLVEARVACRPRVDVEQVELLVVDDLEDMRVSADVQVGLLFLQDVSHLRHVMAGITADVGHVDIDILDMEKQVLGVLHPHHVVVDVAVDGAQGLERSQGLGRLDVADVTRMPQLVDVLEEVEQLRNQGAVRIRKNAYFFHLRLIINPIAKTSLNCTFEPSIFTLASS